MRLEIFAHTDILSLIPSKQQIQIKTTPFPSGKNYAAQCNLAATNSKAEWLLFFAPNVAADARVLPAISNVFKAIDSANDRIAVLELPQLPLETGHDFNPITLETQTIELTAFACRASVFAAASGLDPHFDLFGGQDFARRVQALGFQLQYLPTAPITVPNAYDYLQAPTLTDYLTQVREPLLLAAKYGNIVDINREKFRYWATIKKPKHFQGVRKQLLLQLPNLLSPGFSLFFWRYHHRSLFQSIAQNGYQNKTIPQRGRAKQLPLIATPLVSVVVRTCGRPAVLSQTLISLSHQTYSNFEIVIMEDGAPTAKEMVVQNFSNLPIRYFSTGQNVGRGRAGNLGIEHAKGEFICFLDDDDFFYPDYLSFSVAQLQSEDGIDLLYSPIMAYQIDVAQRTPTYEYTIQSAAPVLFDHITLMDMCVKCRVPMSGAIFRRSLYDQVGGMREDIDADEDWAMWLRYSMISKRKNPNGVAFPRALSACVFPADPALAAQRHEAYRVFDFTMLSDPNLQFTVTKQDLVAWREQVLRDLSHLKSLGQTEQLLNGREAWPRFTPSIPEGQSNITLTALEINGYYQTILDENS